MDWHGITPKHPTWGDRGEGKDKEMQFTSAVKYVFPYLPNKSIYVFSIYHSGIAPGMQRIWILNHFKT